MSSPEDERELVTRVLEGDQDAFEELVHGYKGVVYGTLRRFRTLSDDDVEDLFQDVFQRLLENRQRALRSWQGRPLGAYLKRITRNAAIDFLRKRGEEIDIADIDDLHDQVVLTEEDPGPAGAILLGELRRMMNDAIRRLSSGDQLLLRHLYFEELSYAEIAERLSITINTAGVRIMRAKNRLAEMIRREFPALLEYL